MLLDESSKNHLQNLIETSQFAFDGMSSRWDDLQPVRKFKVKVSEDFHLGFMFGKIEENFTSWFYSKYGRSLEDDEYKEFWSICRKHVRRLHEKYDLFYFQE
jgi:hypothetical protein